MKHAFPKDDIDQLFIKCMLIYFEKNIGKIRIQITISGEKKLGTCRMMVSLVL